MFKALGSKGVGLQGGLRRGEQKLGAFLSLGHLQSLDFLKYFLCLS